MKKGLLCAAVAIAVAIPGVAAGFQGGGNVVGTPLSDFTFGGSLASADNSGDWAEIFTGSLYDANGEQDFRAGTLLVTLSGPVSGVFEHVILANEFETGPEPTDFDADGWKIWSDTHHDGRLHFSFRYRYTTGTPDGVYTFTSAFMPRSEAPIAGPVDQTTVTVFSKVTVGEAPVGLDGAPSGTLWGMWIATPGASNVVATNYVKLVNNGQNPNARVVVDFSTDALSGADADYMIPLDGNIQFAVCEVAAWDVAPSVCTFNYGATSPDASTSVTFSGIGRAMYVSYRLVQVPAVVAAQDYGGAYTVDEL